MTHRPLDGNTPCYDEIGSEKSGIARVKKVPENASGATERNVSEDPEGLSRKGDVQEVPSDNQDAVVVSESRDQRYGECRVELDCENLPSEPTQLPGQDALTCPDLNHEIRGRDLCLLNERCSELRALEKMLPELLAGASLRVPPAWRAHEHAPP